jgi:hypothetical protein
MLKRCSKRGVQVTAGNEPRTKMRAVPIDDPSDAIFAAGITGIFSHMFLCISDGFYIHTNLKVKALNPQHIHGWKGKGNG